MLLGLGSVPARAADETVSVTGAITITSPAGQPLAAASVTFTGSGGPVSVAIGPGGYSYAVALAPAFYEAEIEVEVAPGDSLTIGLPVDLSAAVPGSTVEEDLVVPTTTQVSGHVFPPAGFSLLSAAVEFASSLPSGVSSQASTHADSTGAYSLVALVDPGSRGFATAMLGEFPTSLNTTEFVSLGPGFNEVDFFIPSPHTLTVTKAGSGTVTSAPAGINCGSTCAFAFANGTQVALTASAQIGSAFTGWSGACTGHGGCTVTMGQAQAVTATFAARPPAKLTLAKSGHGSGTVTSRPSGISCGSTCSRAFKYGTSVTLSAHAASGSVFTAWSGACTGSGTTCHVSMTAARKVTATFAVAKLLTVAKLGTGSGTVTSSPAGVSCGTTCKHPFAAGTMVTLTASVSSGSTFSGWSGACSGTGKCVLTMSAAKSVKAAFTLSAGAPRTRQGLGELQHVHSRPQTWFSAAIVIPEQSRR
jgi:hypothetical protein